MGFVRKKKARVTWNRETEVMIVAPEMSAMMVLSRLKHSKSQEVERKVGV